MTTPRDIFETIVKALANGHSPAMILDENSPILGAIRDELKRPAEQPIAWLHMVSGRPEICRVEPENREGFKCFAAWTSPPDRRSVRAALREAIRQVELHNEEYEHSTPADTIAHWRALASYPQEPGTLMDALLEVTLTPEPNALNWQGFDADGTCVDCGTRFSEDAAADMRIATAAMELRDAVRKRSVKITPAQLYRHIIGEDYVEPATEQPDDHTANVRTPSARWRADRAPDPHGIRYECERAQLAMGHMTDDELANAVYLTPSVPYLTAAKDRIRWLSRHAVKWHNHSVALNRVLWRMAVALGDVSAEADAHYGDIDSTIDRFFAMVMKPFAVVHASKAGVSPPAINGEAESTWLERVLQAFREHGSHIPASERRSFSEAEFIAIAQHIKRL